MILSIKKINEHSLTSETLDTTRVAVVLHVRTKLHRVYIVYMNKLVFSITEWIS